MDFALSDDQLAIRDAARQFAAQELAPGAAERDAQEQIPRALIDKVAAVGYLGGVIPEQYGGAGLDYISYAVLLEELSRVDHAIACLASFPSGLCGGGILRYGSERLKQEYLKGFCSGERLGAAAVTEPGSGTDVAGMRTTCRKVDGGYVLQGSKMWISNLQHAEWFITFARLVEEGERGPVCAFIVDRDREGVDATPVKDKLGFRPLSSGEVVFDDVFVPSSHLIGEEGQGFAVAMTAVENGRLGVAARAVGVLAAVVDEVTDYARTRETFGNPIGSYQLVQSKIADMVVGLETARLLTLRLAAMKDAGGERLRLESSLAKMHASDALMRASVDAAQIFGAYCASPEYPIGRHLRDAKVFQIVEGSNDLHKLLIAEQQTGLRSSERARGERKPAAAAA
jgi:alkylation response protein AidB-like acyl-CoA dehydrogenase